MGEVYKVGDWVTVVSNIDNSETHSCHSKSWYTVGKTFQVAKNEGKSTVLKGGVDWIHCSEHRDAISSNQLRYATPDEIRAAGGQVTGSGVKRKLSEITGKAVVHCRTQQEADIICKQLMQLPMYKDQSASSWANYWEVYKEEQCYEIGNGGGGYSDKPWWEKQGYTIYPASDFIETGVTSIEYNGPAINQQPVMVTEDNWYVGMKVTKGRDWKWKGQGDEIGEIYKDEHVPKWISVKWANGQKNNYRIGAEDRYDLYIYQEETSNSFNNQIKTNTNGKSTEYSGNIILSTVKVQITGSAPIRGTAIGGSTKASAITSRPLSYTAIHSS